MPGPPDEDLASVPGGVARPQHGDVEHTLDLWRGERLRRRKLTPGWLADQEHAVTRALAHLQRSPTLDDLIQAYFGDFHRSDPEDWPVTACRTQSGRGLHLGIVEDAASWRRAHQLIAAVTE